MGDDLRPTLDRARKGDREAFGHLVRSYHRRVYMTAYRMMGNHDDANDVVQDAFVRAMRGLKGFDGRSDFFTWLYRIVINVALNHLRQRKRRRAVSIEQVVLPERLHQEADGDPKRKLELKRMAVEIGQAIADLPDTLQATLVLVVLEGVSYRDAAEILECSEGTVAWRVHEARQRLLGRLGKYLGRRGATTENDDELRGDTTEAVDGSR
jgi:RNA polymerase sigma-70 factor (ECF subfamily)